MKNDQWWTKSWSPITGCSEISPGCINCWARRMATRLRGRCGYPADDPFRVTFHPERLTEPRRWRKPCRIFVCSMGDLFHPDVDTSVLDAVFSQIATVQYHTFLVLTKRPGHMAEYINRSGELGGWDLGFHAWPLSNLWLGVTVCNQEEADAKIPALLRIPAARHFVSIEPMLGPVNLPSASFTGAGSLSAMEGLDWVIVGGETGPGARPMRPDWVRSIRDQCKAADVPLFFKSWGEWAPCHMWGMDTYLTEEGQKANPLRNPQKNGVMARVGKRAAGHLLDGREYREVPE